MACSHWPRHGSIPGGHNVWSQWESVDLYITLVVYGITARWWTSWRGYTIELKEVVVDYICLERNFPRGIFTLVKTPVVSRVDTVRKCGLVHHSSSLWHHHEVVDKLEGVHYWIERGCCRHLAQYKWFVWKIFSTWYIYIIWLVKTFVESRVENTCWAPYLVSDGINFNLVVYNDGIASAKRCWTTSREYNIDSNMLL